MVIVSPRSLLPNKVTSLVMGVGNLSGRHDAEQWGRCVVHFSLIPLVESGQAVPCPNTEVGGGSRLWL